MAKPGRKPKPTALKLIEGNPGKRPVNKNAPKPKPVAPPCPASLDAVGKACWRRNAKVLEPLGLLTEADRDALYRYCQAYSISESAWAYISQAGVLVARQHGKTENGKAEAVKNPAVQVWRDTVSVMQHEAAKFGMTPSDRGQMSIKTDDGEDDWGF